MQIKPETLVLMGRIKNFPTCPPFVQELLPLLYSNGKESDQYAFVLQDRDGQQKLLRILNAFYTEFKQPFNSIRQAKIYVGGKELAYMAVICALLQAFPGLPDKSLYSKSVWDHAIGCAVAAEVLAEHTQYAEPREAFLAGLVQNVGKVIWEQYFSDDLVRILRHVKDYGSLLCDAELTVAGVGHDQIALWVAKQWELPLFCQAAAAWCREPHKAEAFQELVHLVHVADGLVRALSVADLLVTGDERMPLIAEQSWKACKLSRTALEQIFPQITSRAQRARVFLHMQ